MSLPDSGKKKYDAPRSFYELFKNERLAKNFFTKAIKVIDVNEIDDEELKKKHYAGVMMYLMHHIYEKEILPYIEEIAEIIKIIAKEDRNYLEDMLKYIIDKGETENTEKLLSVFQ